LLFFVIKWHLGDVYIGKQSSYEWNNLLKIEARCKKYNCAGFNGVIGKKKMY
jgi:hypothetical protein